MSQTLYSKSAMGFFAINEKHLPLIAGLFTPPKNEGGRILDPVAGEGVALEYLSQTWGMTPFANEYDKERAAICQEKFGRIQAVHGDMFSLEIKGTFEVVYLNPPYGTSLTSDTGRTESEFLRHGIRWTRPTGGYLLYVVYKQHLTPEVAEIFAVNSQWQHIYALPGKDLGYYDQVLVVAKVGNGTTAYRAVERFLEHAENPIDITGDVKAQLPHNVNFPYPLAEPRKKEGEFIFRQKVIDFATLMDAVDRQKESMTTFMEMFYLPAPEVGDMVGSPVIMPKQAQLGLITAAVFQDGEVLPTVREDDEILALRSSVNYVTQKVKENDIEKETKDGEKYIVTQTVYHHKPSVEMTVINSWGRMERLTGEYSQAKFIGEKSPRLVEYINQNMKPIYDFDYKARFPYIDKIALRKRGEIHPLKTTQKHVVAALSRLMDILTTRRRALLQGTMGTGKSFMSAATIEHMRKSGKLKVGEAVVYIVPPNVAEKIPNEVKGVYPDAHVREVRTAEDAKLFFQHLDENPNQLHVMCIAETMLKLSEGFETGVHWTYAPVMIHEENPDTGEIVSYPKRDENGKLVLKRVKPVDPQFGTPIVITSGEKVAFAHPAFFNDGKQMWEVDYHETTMDGFAERKSCRVPLWQDGRSWSAAPLIDEDDPRLNHPVYDTKHERNRRLPMRLSLIHQDYLSQALRSSVPDAATAVMRVKDGNELGTAVLRKEDVIIPPPPKKAARVPLADYILKYHKNKLGYVIVDEIHQYSNPSSARAVAAGRMVQAAKYALGMSGTIFGGTASSIYFIEWLFNPQFMQKYFHRDKRGQSRWVNMMGIMQETTTSDRATDHDAVDITGKYSGRKAGKSNSTFKELPGISPVCVRLMLDHTVMVNMNDMSSEMPPYDISYEIIDMDTEMQGIYGEADEVLKKYLADLLKKGDNSFSSTYLQTLLIYPNRYWEDIDVIHKIRMAKARGRARYMQGTYQLYNQKYQHHVHFLPGIGNVDDLDTLSAKERRLIEYVRSELSEGRGCTIYFDHTGGYDIQPRIKAMLERHVQGANVYILRSNIDSKKRESHLEKKAAKGMNVLLTNPKQVAVGIDLVFNPTIIYYEIPTSLPLISQSSARHWRLIQKRACKTIFMAYRDTLEHQMLKLVAAKMVAADTLYGNEYNELAEIAETEIGDLRDMLTQAIASGGEIKDATKLWAETRKMVQTESSWIVDEPEVTPTEVDTPEFEVTTTEEAVISEEQKPVLAAKLTKEQPVHDEPAAPKQMSMFDYMFESITQF